MKRTLILTGIAFVMASCTKDEIQPLSTQKENFITDAQDIDNLNLEPALEKEIMLSFVNGPNTGEQLAPEDVRHAKSYFFVAMAEGEVSLEPIFTEQPDGVPHVKVNGTLKGITRQQGPCAIAVDFDYEQGYQLHGRSLIMIKNGNLEIKENGRVPFDDCTVVRGGAELSGARGALQRVVEIGRPEVRDGYDVNDKISLKGKVNSFAQASIIYYGWIYLPVQS